VFLLHCLASFLLSLDMSPFLPSPSFQVPDTSGMATASSSTAASYQIVQIPSPKNNTSLLTRVGFLEGETEGSNGRFESVFVYLHGFPDMSVDFRPEKRVVGEFASRLPRKLNEMLLQRVPKAAFVCFNFSGVAGSDEGLPFFEKSISAEVEDALAVVAYAKDFLLVPNGSIHVIGVSTGAIIASLLRGVLPAACTTITAIAGLLDLKRGLKFDFDEQQMSDMDTLGYCKKQFWLPPGYTHHDGTSPIDTLLWENEPAPEVEDWKACNLKLGRQYTDEIRKPRGNANGLSIEGAVATTSAPPFLVLHGEADSHVPITCGRALFAAAADPKEFFVVKKANHFLSSSKDFKRAVNAIIGFVGTTTFI
jgi:pimeloyl-ACP methyl ester carboxylesterase